MKVIITAALLLAGGSAYADNVYQRCKPAKGTAVIFFGNGVQNGIKQAEDTRATLERRYRALAPVNADFKDIVVCLAYNYDEFALGDVDQVLKQKIAEYAQSADESYRQVMRELSQRKNKPANLQKAYDDAYAAHVGKLAKEVYDGDRDVRKHVRLYTQSLAHGNPVVILAHSQGSLYANSAFRMLNKKQKKSATEVFVGAAAGEIFDHASQSFSSSKGRWTRHKEDKIISSLAAFAPLPPLSANTSHRGESWTHHLFIEDYMNDAVAGPKIDHDVALALRDVRKKPVEQQTLAATLTFGGKYAHHIGKVHLDILEAKPRHVYDRSREDGLGKFWHFRNEPTNMQGYLNDCSPDGVGEYLIGVHVDRTYIRDNDPGTSIDIQIDAGKVAKQWNLKVKDKESGRVTKPRALAIIKQTYDAAQDKCAYEFVEPTTLYFDDWAQRVQ